MTRTIRFTLFPSGQLYSVSWALVEVAWAWNSGQCVRSPLLKRQVSQSRESIPWLGSWLYHLTFSNNKGYICFLFVSRSTHVMAYVWKSEDNMQASILSFNHMSPVGRREDWTQVIRLDSKLNPLCHLTGFIEREIEGEGRGAGQRRRGERERREGGERESVSLTLGHPSCLFSVSHLVTLHVLVRCLLWFSLAPLQLSEASS